MTDSELKSKCIITVAERERYKGATLLECMLHEEIRDLNGWDAFRARGANHADITKPILFTRFKHAFTHEVGIFRSFTSIANAASFEGEDIVGMLALHTTHY